MCTGARRSHLPGRLDSYWLLVPALFLAGLTGCTKPATVTVRETEKSPGAMPVKVTPALSQEPAREKVIVASKLPPVPQPLPQEALPAVAYVRPAVPPVKPAITIRATGTGVDREGNFPKAHVSLAPAPHNPGGKTGIASLPSGGQAVPDAPVFSSRFQKSRQQEKIRSTRQFPVWPDVDKSYSAGLKRVSVPVRRYKREPEAGMVSGVSFAGAPSERFGEEEQGRRQKEKYERELREARDREEKLKEEFQSEERKRERAAAERNEMLQKIQRRLESLEAEERQLREISKRSYSEESRLKFTREELERERYKMSRALKD